VPAWNDEGCEKDRQESLSGASEGDDLALGGVEGLSAARISAIADLQGMTSRLDWYLDRAVHLDRPDLLTIEYDIVRATADLRSDCLMRQLQRCRHLLISSWFSCAQQLAAAASHNKRHSIRDITISFGPEIVSYASWHRQPGMTRS
jgi:hypothetical protein